MQVSSPKAEKNPRLRQGFGRQARAKGSRNQKGAKSLSFRLAETEHELVVRKPLVVGLRPTAVQSQTVVAALQPEDERVAVRSGDLLHADINPLI